MHVFHHGTHKYPDLHRRIDITNPSALRIIDPDVDDLTKFPDQAVDASFLSPVPKLTARSETLNIQRLADRSDARIDRLLDAGRERGSPMELSVDAWTVDEVPSPNVTDKETVLSMARMAADAYVLDDQGDGWFDVGSGFNYTDDFGWTNDGLRGHVFVDETNQTVVIAVKGTCKFTSRHDLLLTE
jgi:lipase ATG15